MKIKQFVQTIQTGVQPLAQPNRHDKASGLAVRTGVRAGDALPSTDEFSDALKELGVNFVLRDLPQPGNLPF